MISIILAAGRNNVIGKDNKIPWRLPADMRHFKQITIGNIVIMGRKTFESIGKPLVDRVNIVITRRLSYEAEGIIVANSFQEALNRADDHPGKEIFIIGGAEIYMESMSRVDRIYFTRIESDFEGDAFFPELNMMDWKLISSEPHQADEKNRHDYTFEVYERIN